MTAVLPTTLGGPHAVATRGLVKRYRSESALDGLELQVPEGAVYVLVGPNGAGKSTAFKVLMDLVRADEGAAEVFGLDARRDGPRVRAGVGYVPERHDWGYGWMRVGRLLEHHAAFFDGLLDLGAHNQVIAATTSAPLLRRAPASAVIDLGRGAR